MSPNAGSLKHRAASSSGLISRPGYQPVAFQTTRKPTNTVVGNVLIGGLIEAAVDGASGANNDLSPESINVTLRQEQLPENREPRAAPMRPTTRVSAAKPDWEMVRFYEHEHRIQTAMFGLGARCEPEFSIGI